MKKNILIFGIFAGIIVSAMLVYTGSRFYVDPDWEPSAMLGYASMVIAFSLIFVGVRNYRDKFNGGTISFGKAFLTGIYITLVASCMYVVVWMIDYYIFIPDFMDRYGEYLLKESAKEGSDSAEVLKQINWYKEMYKNPLFVIIMTFLEIFPVGLVISLIAALILKRNSSTLSPVSN